MSKRLEIAPPPVSFRSLPRRQIVLTMAGVMLAMFLSSLDQTIVGTAMPRIISDLGGFTHYTWVTAAYMITSTVAVPITGKLIDMHGRKPLYMTGIGIFILGSLLSGLSQSMTQIIFFRGFQGIGAGIIMANTFTVIGDLFPPAERGKYQGLISAVFGLSSIIGPGLGGLITDSIGWHWIFFINIPLGLAIIVLFAIFFPGLRPASRRHRMDYAGVSTLILAVVPAMLALTWAGVDYAWLSPQITGMFAFAVIMGVLFVLIEKRAEEPIIPMSLFRNSIVVVSEVVIFITGIGMFGAIVFVPLFFQGVLGVSATASGSFMTPMMLGVVFGSFISGQLLSRTGQHYRIQGMAGTLIMALGILLLSRMDLQTSYPQAVANIVITGFGLGTTMPLYVIAVQNAVPYRMLGVATSSTAFFRAMGGSLGLAIFGSILNNVFASRFLAGLPQTVRAVIPADRLEFLAHNPQALVSVEAQDQLRAALGQFGPQGAALFDQLLMALRIALDSSLSQVFLIAAVVVFLAFVANWFIKEIPLRRSHDLEDGSPRS